MHPNRRAVLLGAAGLALVMGGCRRRAASLAEVLAPAQGRLVDEGSRPVDVEAFLGVARDRPIALSFAYVGCASGLPRIHDIRRAVRGKTDGEPYHLILDALDSPRRAGLLVADVMGANARLHPEAGRILFVQPDEQDTYGTNRPAQQVMDAMGMAGGRDGYLESVKGTGVFQRGGAFVGVFY